MRVWIWIAIFVMGCSKKSDKQEPITVKQLGDVLVLRIPGPNGQATFVRAGAISVCPKGKPPCRIQGTLCPDCTTPFCDCRRSGCSRMCEPPFWPIDELEFLKELGLVDPKQPGVDREPIPAGGGSADSDSVNGSGRGSATGGSGSGSGG